MASIAANGITIEYEVDGDHDGEPMLLIMGLGGQLVDWPPRLVELLAESGFRVIRFDNRDIGLSTSFDWTPPSLWRQAVAFVGRRRAKGVEYSLVDMAADAAGLLDSLDIESAHVVGTSMGGMIAQQLAIDHGHRVRSLCSIMSHTGNRRHGNPSPQLLGALGRVRRSRGAEADEALDVAIASLAAVAGPHFDSAGTRGAVEASIERSFRPDGVARQAAAISASPDRTAGLRRLEVPTSVIHGLVDPLVRPSGAVATARAVTGSRLLMFADMGHDLPAHRLDEIAAEIAGNARRSLDARRSGQQVGEVGGDQN